MNTLPTAIVPKYAMKVLGALILGTFAALCFGQKLQAQDTQPNWQPTECPAPLPTTAKVECGYLTVPEDHAHPEGRTIQIAVAILKSRAEVSAPDPLVFLNGGPGAHTLQFLEGLTKPFGPFLASRDVIVFDQRGVGYSQPDLACPELNPDTLPNQSIDEALPLILGALSTCKQRYESQGVNLAAYNSAQSAADLDDLRLALGYEQLNLFGASYGTRYALTMMRDRPEGIRSVILASVYPPEVNLYDSVQNANRAFDTLFEGCAASLTCNLFYPNLKSVFYETVEQLDTQPIILSIETDSGEVRDYEVTGARLIDAVFNLLYFAEGTALLPQLIYDLHDGIYDLPRQMLAASSTASISENFSEGMAFSVQCSEEVPFVVRDDLLTSAAAYPEPIRQYIHERLLFTDLSPELCQAWLVAHPDPIENQPVHSDIPTLVLAGGYDPVTPPAWSREAASNLSHSYFYEFPTLGHSIGGVCPMAVMLSFVGDPTRPPAAGCMSRMDSEVKFLIRPEVARWPTVVLSGLLATPVLIYGLLAGITMWKQRTFSWRMSARLAGWIPALISGGVVAILFLSAQSENHLMQPLQVARAIETIIPLVAAMHAALLFSPADESALEIALAAPRPMAWTLLERWSVLIVQQSVVGSIATIVSIQYSGEAFEVAFMRWFAQMCFLAGVALCITLTTRQPVFSAGLMLLVCFGLAWAGDGMLANYPYLWPLQAFLQPDHYLFWLNRIFLVTAGFAAVVMAARIMNDSERMLLGRGASNKSALRNVREAA